MADQLPLVTTSGTVQQLAAGDSVSAARISNVPAGGVTSTVVQGAINELDIKKAPLASPAFTGTPTAPTAATGTTTTQLATTAFVQTAISLIPAAGAISNVVSSATTIATDKSYTVISYLTINSDLTLNGNLMMIG